jgi:hypothetical protein
MEQANLETWKTALMGETLIFGMLGNILYAEPDKDWLGDLIREEVFADFPGEEAEARKESATSLSGEISRRSF